ncbi:tyrosine-protein phosphatase [Cellulomonas sp. P5_C6]
MPADPDPHVLFSPAVTNLRDLGGRRTADGGVVASGVVYRSAEMTGDAVATDEVLAGLGIRTVVDLRTEGERTARPDHVPAGATLLDLDVLADLPGGAAAQVAALGTSRTTPEPDPDPVESMLVVYRRFVVGEGARAAYAALMRAVIDPARRPLLFHCTAGKDRTGWAATILLLAAGVDEQGATEEFLAVNPAVRETFAPLLQQFADTGGDPETLRPLLEVRPEDLREALDLVREQFGTFDGYLRDGLGLAPQEVEKLRRTLRTDG